MGEEKNKVREESSKQIFLFMTSLTILGHRDHNFDYSFCSNCIYNCTGQNMLTNCMYAGIRVWSVL